MIGSWGVMKCASIAVPGPAFVPGAMKESFSAWRAYSMAEFGEIEADSLLWGWWYSLISKVDSAR